MGSFEYFDHTADVGIRVTAGTLEDLYATAVSALANRMVLELGTIEEKRSHTLELAEPDPALLLHDLLDEVLFLFETDRLICRSARIERSAEGKIRATLVGESFDPDRHPPGNEVKAITYHGLSVTQTDGEWVAECILDI